MSQQINLFNPVFMKQRKYFSAIAMLQGLFLVMVGTGLFYVYATYQVKEMKREQDATIRQYADGEAKLKHFTEEFSPEESSKLLDSELKAAEKKLAVQLDLIQTLKGGAIGNATGYSAYMRAFARQSVEGLWLSDFEIIGDGSRISISGSVMRPELLPVYVGRLGSEGVMRGRSFAALQMQRRNDGTGAVEFTLQSSEAGGGAEK